MQQAVGLISGDSADLDPAGLIADSAAEEDSTAEQLAPAATAAVQCSSAEARIRQGMIDSILLPALSGVVSSRQLHAQSAEQQLTGLPVVADFTAQTCFAFV